MLPQIDVGALPCGAFVARGSHPELISYLNGEEKEMLWRKFIGLTVVLKASQCYFMTCKRAFVWYMNDL